MTATRRGTGLGALAIASWGTLGALGALSATMNPYLVLGCCFAIGAGLGVLYCRATGAGVARPGDQGIMAGALLLTVYHVAYLTAFHFADPISVSLINYLWPACLILVGNLFFGLASGAAGVIGALVGFSGVVILVRPDGIALTEDQMIGYGLAFFGALCWGTYSNLRRRRSGAGVGDMVTISAISAAACLILAAATGPGLSDLGLRDLYVIVLLGIGPAGGAFFLWDIGMRRGNAALLGVIGYAAPIISTLVMVGLGLGSWSSRIVVAVVLISAGGLIVQFGRRPRSGALRETPEGSEA